MMAIPLLWIGAGALALLAGHHYSKELRQQSRIQLMPGEGQQCVMPIDGAIVSCGVFGLFEHTGIWLDGNIVELKGNGLIRAVSPTRFLQYRSGDHIYIACDADNVPLVAGQCAERASKRIFDYCEYDLFKNNCHQFVWQCLSGTSQELHLFSQLNQLMAEHFNGEIHWQKCAIS